MFEKYSHQIAKLNSFEKEDILIPYFELCNENNLKMYYAPHNEYINANAKIFIIGICPGWTQTQIAYKTANNGLKDKLSHYEIQKQCKQNSRFAGSMRKNLIEMLDELRLNEKLNLASCAELFDKKDNLLHTTSVLPFPVFINGKNYTGHTPALISSKLLYSYVEKYFYPEAIALSDALIIPLGKSVEDVLNIMIDKKLIKKENCLLGFPHTSGANGHRKKQFEEHKHSFIYTINDYFNK